MWHLYNVDEGRLHTFLFPIPLKYCNSGSTLSIINPQRRPKRSPIANVANIAILLAHWFFIFQAISAKIKTGNITNVGALLLVSLYLIIIYDKYANVNPKMVCPTGRSGTPSIRLQIGLLAGSSGEPMLVTIKKLRKQAKSTPDT